MRLLLLGSGGREHALAWKLADSEYCEALFIAPGNAGTAMHGENIAINIMDFDAIRTSVLTHQIDMVVVGPELPLVKGIVDFFKADLQLKDVGIIGPSEAAAQLEGSKAFAKEFMEEFGIPTAAYRSFTAEHHQEAIDYLDTVSPPYVLKADGLAAGKGVLILEEKVEAQIALEEMFGGKFGEAGKEVVIEEFLDGLEFSVFVLTDGTHYQVLPAAKDYKRIGEGDKGLNTGGMGSVSPVPFLTDELMEKVTMRIIEPTIQGIQARGLDYKGFIFLGLIRVEGEPYVIEYNCRLGDPETQSILIRLNSDLVALLEATAQGNLNQMTISKDERYAVTVNLVSGGYPGSYEKGKVITGTETVENSFVFHAGTITANDQLLTNGGRVLGLTSYGRTMLEAVRTSTANAERINFEGKYFRKDIGFDL
jgi:phosphoribosylamine--glycine ligase